MLQTVHLTASGIDPQTGFTVGEVMAGRIDDPQVVPLIERQLSNQRQTSENLLPVYDDTGKVIAFERAADPAQTVNLNRNTNIADMIGVWRGRQIEELLAQDVNTALVDNLHQLWEQGKREGRRNEFVNLARLGHGADPVLKEAVKLIPHNIGGWVEPNIDAVNANSPLQRIRPRGGNTPGRAVLENLKGARTGGPMLGELCA